MPVASCLCSFDVCLPAHSTVYVNVPEANKADINKNFGLHALDQLELFFGILVCGGS
jgi:hypothetical protein